jgi:hypothetical protein
VLDAGWDIRTNGTSVAKKTTCRKTLLIEEPSYSPG